VRLQIRSIGLSDDSPVAADDGWDFTGDSAFVE